MTSGTSPGPELNQPSPPAVTKDESSAYKIHLDKAAEPMTHPHYACLTVIHYRQQLLSM